MNPIRHAGVVAFLDWIRRSHPEVTSIKSISEPEFLALATAFEASKGVIIGESHDVYRKWRSTHWIFKESPSDGEALQRLQGFR